MKYMQFHNIQRAKAGSGGADPCPKTHLCCGRDVGKAPDRLVAQAGHLLLAPEHASLINIGAAFVMTMRARMRSIVLSDDFKSAFVDVKMNLTLSTDGLCVVHLRVLGYRRSVPYQGFCYMPGHACPDRVKKACSFLCETSSIVTTAPPTHSSSTRTRKTIEPLV